MSKKLTTAAIGGAFAASLMSTTAIAADNPFAIKQLDSGYQLAMSDKADEGKCGEAKCGEGKCGNKAKEAKCGSKTQEAKCGEGKCGAK